MTASDADPIVQWLVDGARSASTPDMVLEQLCARLTAAGIPLWRVGIFVRTLHPDVSGRRFLWRLGHAVSVVPLTYEREDTDDFRLSPVARVWSTGVSMRFPLTDPAQPPEYAVLKDLRDQGATDYFATPLPFTNGEIHMASWSTQRHDGFRDEEIAAIERIATPLARMAEIWALRRTATNLLDTYVGHQAGERILGGRIRRGDTESIHAAIWLSDMRGFTTLSDRIAPDAMISLLNRYFDCQVPAIIEHGGEVLKFMGDGLLAIFPILEPGVETRVCRAALAAAREAQAKIAAVGELPVQAGVESLRFGLALHLGHVLYGNIGGGNRLDFTCIGPAVNLAARVEKLAAQLQEPILASEEFSQRCEEAFVPAGEFALRGFSSKQVVFRLSENSEH